MTLTLDVSKFTPSWLFLLEEIIFSIELDAKSVPLIFDISRVLVDSSNFHFSPVGVGSNNP